MTREFVIHASSDCPNPEGNTNNQFTIQLPTTLRFHSQWSVALTRIQYMRNWVTLLNQYIEVFTKTGHKKFLIRNVAPKNVEDLVDFLNVEINAQYVSARKKRSETKVVADENFIKFFIEDFIKKKPQFTKKDQIEKWARHYLIRNRWLNHELDDEKLGFLYTFVENRIAVENLAFTQREDVESTLNTSYAYTDQRQQEPIRKDIHFQTFKPSIDEKSSKPKDFLSYIDVTQVQEKRKDIIKDYEKHQNIIPDLSVTRVPLRIEDTFKKDKERVPIDRKPQLIENAPNLPAAQAWISEYDYGSKEIEFTYDELRQKIVLWLSSNIFKVFISKDLSYMLGFDRQEFFETSHSKYPPNYHGTINSIYVYMPKNIIQESIHSNKMAPVLRAFAASNTYDQMVENVFIDPEYHNLIQKEISQLSFEIKSSENKLIPFTSGVVTLTLKFKKDLLL